MLSQPHIATQVRQLMSQFVTVVSQLCRTCVTVVSHLCCICVTVVSSIFAHTTQGEQLGTVKVCIEHYQVTYELRCTNRALIGHQQSANRVPEGHWYWHL